MADLPGLRPTSDRIRETLFNWLQPRLGGSVCVDLFCGSGALALEALSRGASRVVAIDSHAAVVASLEQARRTLRADNLEIIRDDAEHFLSGPGGRSFDIVFVDPPFGHELHRSVFVLLEQNDWLADEAVVYIECERGAQLHTPARWTWLKRADAGNVSYGLLSAVRC